ncbi:MAG: NAD(P)H-quinone oxidoreductase subunit F, partial [Merismopedia sp. SIO2A8]|nr:NAD(P)H-quinone oxidoreductase subunit F [Merismopedia sp. SIO2A8]
FNKSIFWLLLCSSLIGCIAGTLTYVGQRISKPIQLPWRQLQDFFAYDLYTPKLYRSSIVFSVDWASRIADWFDRFIIDGVVNLVGLASIFGGEALKYGNSGQGQFYLLTIALGSLALTIALSWSLISQLLLPQVNF